MLISYYEDGSVHNPPTRRLQLVMLANCLFAGLVLSSWTLISLFVVGPLEWATWMPVSRGNSIEEAIRYPFCILWLWPLLGVAGAWLANKSGKVGLAYICAALPLVIMSLIFGWFYLVPIDWQ